jgi:hypothetical protein
MRDFFKQELKTLYARTQSRQYETISAMPDAAEQFKVLLDTLEEVCNKFNYIPETAQQNIIRERILSDKDFIGLNAKVVYKWFMEVRDTYFKESAHIKEVDTANPVTYDELSPETKAKVDDFIKGLQSETGGLKSVPQVSQAEIDAIKIEDLEERVGRKAIEFVRPEFVVGEPCPNCGGDGYTIGTTTIPECCGNTYPSGQCKSTCAIAKQVPIQEPCERCQTTGEINRVKVHASSIEEARKAYKATFNLK